MLLVTMTAKPDDLKRKIKDIPERQRPREEIERLGVGNVSDHVLIAVLLRSGVKGKNVVEVAQTLLNTYGTLANLARASMPELARIKGIGKVKAQILAAALELARRLAEEQVPVETPVTSPIDAARLLSNTARTLEKEAFWVLLLDSKNRLKKSPMPITHGLLAATQVDPREVFKEAIRYASAAVVLVHNHPSGDTKPSAEDVRITRQMVEAGQLLSIPVLDHVILGTGPVSTNASWFSFRESGLVSFPK